MTTRLQQHFKTTNGIETVSQEGLIGDAVGWMKALFRYRPADHEKLTKAAMSSSMASVSNIQSLRKLLDKCFLQERWLDHQELVEGNVNALTIAPRLAFGAIKEPSEYLLAVSRGNDIVDGQLDAFLKAIHADADFVRDRFSRTVRDVSGALQATRNLYTKLAKVDENGVKVEAKASILDMVLSDILPAAAAQRRMSALLTDIQHRPGAKAYWGRNPKFELFGANVESGTVAGRKVVSVQHAFPTELPALNKQQIIELARILMNWIDLGLLYHPREFIAGQLVGAPGRGWAWRLANVSDWKPEDGAPEDDYDAFWYIVRSTPQGRELTELLSKTRFLDDWLNDSDLFTTVQGPAVAIVKWIGASIKGRLSS